MPTGIIEMIEAIIAIQSLIPLLIITFLYVTIIFVIIFIIILIYNTLKDFDIKKLIASIGTALFSFISYINMFKCMESDGEIFVTPEKTRLYIIASFFAFITSICFGLFIYFCKKGKSPELSARTSNKIKKYCASCDKEVEENEDFCKKCGNKL